MTRQRKRPSGVDPAASFISPLGLPAEDHQQKGNDVSENIVSEGGEQQGSTPPPHAYVPGGKRSKKASPFANLQSLRLPQDYRDDKFGVKPLITRVPVRRPLPQEFVRVRPEEEYRISGVGIYKDKIGGAQYLVTPEICDELDGYVRRSTILTSITRQGVTLLWPIVLPDDNGRLNSWPETEWEVAREAETNWVRMTANQALGGYEAKYAFGDLPEPVWPDLTLEQLLTIGFRQYLIDSREHPMIRMLRGEE